MRSQGVSVITASYKKLTEIHIITPVINHLVVENNVKQFFVSPCSPSGPGWTVRKEL